jgi:hypothetical protein
MDAWVAEKDMNLFFSSCICFDSNDTFFAAGFQDSALKTIRK